MRLGDGRVGDIRQRGLWQQGDGGEHQEDDRIAGGRTAEGFHTEVPAAEPGGSSHGQGSTVPFPALRGAHTQAARCALLG